MKLLPGLLLAFLCRATTATEGDCWSDVSKQFHSDGTTGFYQCKQYTCTTGEWEATGITDPDCDIFADGCWSPTVHKMMPFGTKGWYKCDQMECVPGKISWKPTGERLPNCPAGSMACHDWMKNATVPVESTMYFECNQYLCTENDFVQNGERDPSCETNGCFSVVTQEVSPYGLKGYWKCEEMECMKDKTWKPTGERLPGCPEGSVNCWDWMKNETVPIGSSMDFKKYAYKCTENDWEQTGPISLEQCTEGHKWKQDCNECICRNGQGVCTTRACIPGDWPQRGNTLPSGADCSDGSSFKKECNDCTCSNGKVICTLKACLPNFEHPPDTELCKEGSLWKTDDCNTCRCRDNKQLCTRRLCRDGSQVIPGRTPQIGVMPLGASVLQQPMENKEEAECQIEEGSTDRFRKECNWCRCIKGKGVCTRRGCPPEINERLESEPSCEGTIMFKKDCNWCSCVDGRAICTFRACLPGSFGRPQTHSPTLMTAAVHRTRAQPPGSQQNKNEILCTAGSLWRIKCNSCRCINGKGVCTKMACPSGPDRNESPVCEGESSWKIKCNWCNCTDGQAVCQRRVCSSRPFIPREPDVASISNTEDECTEGSNWRRDCNWCRCVRGKGVCSRRACIPEITNQFDDKPECVGEAQWKVNCNWCSCRDSKALCTLKACLPAHTSPSAIGVIKDDEPECSDGSKWMKSCNQCQCRNGKESCSKKACPPPQVLSASDQPECEGSSQWRKDCNLCQCVEERAVCTLRACLTPARPSTGISVSGTDSDIDCEEGARWRKDCNWCSCMKGRGGCTKKGCMALPGTEPVWKSLPECEGTSRFKKDCNWCSCQDGTAVCTEKACLPTDVRSPPSSSDAQCLDGSTWKDKCNSCSCMNGRAACTLMMCLPDFKPSDNEEECSSGAFWKKDCNTCRCVNGKGVCTRRACFTVSQPATELCSLPAIAPGAKVCGGFMRKWTFNSEDRECQQIVYGGCGGTENLFSTIEECQTACKSSQGAALFRSGSNRPENCKLPMEAGPCFASKAKFAFNQTSNRCERFYYGGCQGNANNFNSAQECSDECGGDPPVFDAGCDRSKCKWSRWSHYTSKGCLPQYDNGACCPTSFTCPSQGPSDSNICHYRGKDYAIGDQVPIAEDCEAACRCAPGFSPGAGADVRCASVECPDLFRAPEPNCRQLYRTGECCSYTKDCQDPDSPPQLDSELVTCEWNNKTYREGDRMYFDGEYNCQKCICSRNFNGPTGAGCDLITCGFDFRYSSKFQKGCTPIYFEDKCCPIDWMCPGDSRVASQPQSPATRDDSMKCTMGDLSLKFGATLKLNERNCDTKCECLTPPEFTCVKHRNCDLANGEQNSPQISVRRGNLDCPPVNCGEGCALLTDLRTGCHFCSCGADVVTCPELSCHESCHTVQDTNSGCPRCECNCPKDPLGNPPCPMDCAVHFVKDLATGCEKCECTPGSSSPFPRPIPLPERINN